MPFEHLGRKKERGLIPMNRITPLFDAINFAHVIGNKRFGNQNKYIRNLQKLSSYSMDNVSG